MKKRGVQGIDKQMNKWDNTALYPDILTSNTLDAQLTDMMLNGAFNPITKIPVFDGDSRIINQLEMMESKYTITKYVLLLDPEDVCLDRHS